MSGLQLGFALGRRATAALAAEPRIAGNNIVYAIGDSRSGLFNAPSGAYNQRYPLTVARQLLNGQMVLPFTNVGQTGGYTLQQIYDNHFAPALASTAKTLILLGGTNSAGANVATNIALCATMADAWCDSAADRVIHILDECPWGGTAGDEAGHQALRDGIRALSAPQDGINIVPSWRAATGGNDGITPLADTYMDTVHFATPGSMRVGRALAASLQPTLPVYDFYTRLPAVALSQTFVAGTVAANDMTLDVGSITSGSVTASMVTFEGNVWMEIVMAAALGTFSFYRASFAIPGGWVAGTTLFESNMDFILKSGHANVRRAGLTAYKQSGVGQPHYSTGTFGPEDGASSGSGSDATVLSYPDGEELRGVYWTPRMRHAADATSFRPWRGFVSSRTSLPMSGTILLKRPQCRVV